MTDAKKYALLAEGFWNVPSKTYLTTLKDSISVFDDGSKEAAQGIQGIMKNLESIDEDLIHQLAVDYTMTFAGQRADGPFPYESIYANDERLLRRACCDEVVQTFRRFGFSPRRNGSNEPEDHLSLLLDFVSFLLEREADARQANDTEGADALRVARESFLNTHVRTWVPTFAEEVKSTSEYSFYPSLAKLAQTL